MRAYYLNPKMSAEDLKALDAQADAHVAMCKTEFLKLVHEQRFDDCEAVRQARVQIMVYIVQSMMTFG